MSGLELGSWPGELLVRLTLGDGAHLVATSANGWAGPVTLVWGPDGGQWTEETSTLTDPGTVDGTEVSWTLTVEQVTARSAFPYARLVDNGMTLKAGEVIPWTGGLGSTATQTIASLTAGPPGPTAVSADAGNILTTGTDSLLYLGDAQLAAGVEDYLTENPPDAAPDADATTKGLIRLAGDLGGTADSPTVPGLADKANTADLGTAAAAATTDFATAAQGALADTASQPGHDHVAADVTDLTETVQDIVAAFVVAGTNVTVTHDDVANTFTINATASGGGETDPEIVRDVIGAALHAGSGIQITVDDAGDQITIASTAVLPTRTVSAGTGLTGGGDLSANRTLSVDFGTGAGKVTEGNDSRLNRVPDPTSEADGRFLVTSGGDLVYDDAPEGGGGGIARAPVDTITLDPTYGDDFTGASLDAKWTRNGFTSSVEAYQQGYSGSCLSLDWSGGAAFRALTQPIPGSGDFEAVLSVSSFSNYAAFPIWGLVLFNADDSGLGVFAYNNPASFAGTVTAGGAYSSAVGTHLGTIANAYAHHSLGARSWFRIRRVGSTYSFASSRDGDVFFTHHSATAASATKIGVARVFNSPTTHLVLVDRFNMRGI